MLHRIHDRLIVFGFWLAYLGVMGSLFVWTTPLFAEIRSTILVYGFAPATVLGVLFIVGAHLLYPRL